MTQDSNMEPMDERTRQRIGVLELFRRKHPTEFGALTLYERLTEPQAAVLMEKDASTLKRARRRGEISAIRDNGRVYYLAYQVCDWWLAGMKDAWNGVERRKAQKSYTGPDRRTAA
jgi:hypothetical protein